MSPETMRATGRDRFVILFGLLVGFVVLTICLSYAVKTRIKRIKRYRLADRVRETSDEDEDAPQAQPQDVDLNEDDDALLETVDEKAATEDNSGNSLQIRNIIYIS